MTKQYCERHSNVTYGKKYFLLGVGYNVFLIRDDNGRKLNIPEMYISEINRADNTDYMTYSEMFQAVGGKLYNYFKEKGTACINDVWSEYLSFKHEADLSTRRQIAAVLNQMSWLEPVNSFRTKQGMQKGWRFKA